MPVQKPTWLQSQVHISLYHSLINSPQSYEFRYAQLRANYFSADSLKLRFQKYFKLFRNTGAAEREKARWNNRIVPLNFDEEEQYICQWIDGRLDYLDRQYNYNYWKDVLAHITAPAASADYSECPLSIYSITGQYIGNVKEANLNYLNLSKGIYIINNKKYVVR